MRSLEQAAVIGLARFEPTDVKIQFNAALALQNKGLWQEAIVAYRAALRVQPDYAGALWNVSELYRVNDMFGPAIACLQSLLELGVYYPALHHRLAVAYACTEEYEKADHYFGLALQDTGVNLALTQWEYSHMLLKLGRFEAGWAAYGWRFDAGISVCHHPFPFPVWDGNRDAPLTLLVHGEQGLGDQIMFAGLMPELMRTGMNIVLAVDPSLVRLFRTSFPGVDVRPHRVIDAPVRLLPDDRIDCHIPIGSLPAALRWGTGTPMTKAPYLVGGARDQKKVGAVLERVSPQDDRLKVGLMWGANPSVGLDWGAKRAAKKSICPSAFEALAGLVRRFCFVSLQNIERAGGAALAPSLDIIDMHGCLLDMQDTAALIECLDVVVTVDTSVAHLAGAMGKRVYLLLMYDADWRWGERGQEDSWWYNDVHVLRQKKSGDWESVVGGLYHALSEYWGGRWRDHWSEKTI